MHNKGSKLKYQSLVVKRLIAMIDNRTLPHALILTGPEGTGKADAAVALAMALNCRSEYSGINAEKVPTGFENNVCGNCRSCSRILTENHPDIIHVRTNGKFIVIAQIREVVRKLTGKPFEDCIRVVIIEDASRMNTEASNSLLKVLEEPPLNTIFILTTPKTDQLLATISSRCQALRFSPVSFNNLTDFLISNLGIDGNKAVTIASLSEGSIDKAEKLTYKDNFLIETRNFIADVISLIKGSSALFYISIAEKIAKDRKTAIDILGIMKIYVRDIIVYRYSPERVFNQDILDKIADISRRFNSSELINIYDYIQSAEKSIESNCALRLTIEVMAMKIAEV